MGSWLNKETQAELWTKPIPHGTLMHNTETRIWITSEASITQAVLAAKKFSVQVGFKDYQASMIASAVSELARNIEKYARRGEIVLRRVSQSYATGIEIIAQDEGPGIANPEEAMKDHYSSSGTLGLGLPGVKRLMDEFDLKTEVERGTVITVRKWL